MAHNGRPKGEDGLVIGLASGLTVRDAAQRAGIGERTAHRRLGAAAFRQRVAEARTNMLDRAIGQLADAATEAVATLRQLLAAEESNVRLAAARAILETGRKLRESHELAQRLDGVERMVIVVKPTPDYFQRNGVKHGQS